MEKFAIVLTSTFPFGKSEDFFAAELPCLLRHFNRIVILTRSREGPQTRPIPDGVEVHRISAVGFRGRLRYLRIPFLGEFWREIQNIRRGGQVKLTVKIVRNLISFIIHGLHMRGKLVQILEEHGRLKNGEGVVLYAYWMEFPAYAALRVKRAVPALKVICRAHGCDLYWERHSPAYLPLRKYIADHIDAAYFISEQGRDYFMRKNQIPNDGRLKVARLGVKGRNVMARASSDGVLRILSCSFVAAVKRLDLIAQALAQIDGFEVEWTHIGDGNEMEELKGLASRLLDRRANIRYSFKGYLRNEQVYDYYAGCSVDALVNVSSSEGVPVSMMEAFAFGVPVLATAVGGVPELVSRANGFLLPADATAGDVARAIGGMRGLPEAEIQALKANAYDTWRKFCNADVNYMKFAEEVLEIAAMEGKGAAFPGAGARAERPPRGKGA
ncbi:MAG: glycosyltransferase [Verrucomicrobiota bacterium]|jgi:glycosyltransferase involved in cell wall biosynthesis